MDNIKINALDNITTVTDNDLLVIETSLGTRSIKVKKFLSGVYEVLNKCFQSVSNGKSLVASAITDKGVETESDAMFAVMAENIRSISSGGTHIAGDYEVVIPIYYGSVKCVSGAYEVLD